MARSYALPALCLPTRGKDSFVCTALGPLQSEDSDSGDSTEQLQEQMEEMNLYDVTVISLSFSGEKCILFWRGKCDCFFINVDQSNPQSSRGWGTGSQTRFFG